MVTKGTDRIRTSPLNDPMCATPRTVHVARYATCIVRLPVDKINCLNTARNDETYLFGNVSPAFALSRILALTLVNTTITQISIAFTELFCITRRKTLLATSTIEIWVSDPLDHLVPFPAEQRTQNQRRNTVHPPSLCPQPENQRSDKENDGNLNTR
jgi:hypothetical protein